MIETATPVVGAPKTSRAEGSTTGPSAFSFVMPLVATLMLVAVAVGINIAKHWPLVHDSPLIHYVVFLMQHGRAPYRDIAEMNMPGSYMFEWLAMRVFGGGDLGWRLWDFVLGAVTISTAAWLTGPGKRSAGIAAGAFAYILHLKDGAFNEGQRDWLVAVLLLVSFGFLFESIRSRRAEWMAGFMCFAGLAASIKPPALGFGICFLAAACWIVRQDRLPGQALWQRFVLWSVAGGLVPLLIVVTFLLYWGVVPDFLWQLEHFLPWFATLQRLPLGLLLRTALTPMALRYFLFGPILLFILRRSWRRWESTLLLCAALAGAVHYVIQGKGWGYHLYPELMFIVLWAMLELNDTLQDTTWKRAIALAALLVILPYTTYRYLRIERLMAYPMATLSHLEQDLGSLGGAQLSGHVQCLDMTMAGCINVLYRMKLVQSTGFIYDYYLFSQDRNVVV